MEREGRTEAIAPDRAVHKPALVSPQTTLSRCETGHKTVKSSKGSVRRRGVDSQCFLAGFFAAGAGAAAGCAGASSGTLAKVAICNWPFAAEVGFGRSRNCS